MNIATGVSHLLRNGRRVTADNTLGFRQHKGCCQIEYSYYCIDYNMLLPLLDKSRGWDKIIQRAQTPLLAFSYRAFSYRASTAVYNFNVSLVSLSTHSSEPEPAVVQLGWVKQEKRDREPARMARAYALDDERKSAVVPTYTSVRENP